MATTTSFGKPNYLHIMALVLLLPYGITSYPVFGTKRYGRSSTPMHNTWGMSSMMHVPSYYYQAIPRPQSHYPLSYYEAMAPYAPDYTDDYYYPQEALSYPLYYPALTRSGSKYDMYQQAAMPYYYGEQHMPRPGYGYYDGSDPVDNLQEEMIQEEEREEREEALPIGQETWYETDGTSSESDESMDDVNAAFLQNLMMYNDAISNQKYDYGKQQPVDSYMQQYKDYNEDYPNWNMDTLNKNYGSEDEDVKELKMLVEKPKKQKAKANKKHTAAQERLQMFEKGNKNQKTTANYDPNNSEAWINWDNKRAHKHIVDPVANLALKKQEHSQHGPTHFGTLDLSFAARKPQTGINSGKTLSTSTMSPTVGVTTTTSTEQPARDVRGGQKEVVLMRPATPVRRPFSEPVMELLAQQGGPERKRTPSVYDTIKHLLEMEKNLEEVSIDRLVF